MCWCDVLRTIVECLLRPSSLIPVTLARCALVFSVFLSRLHRLLSILFRMTRINMCVCVCVRSTWAINLMAFGFAGRFNWKKNGEHVFWTKTQTHSLTDIWAGLHVSAMLNRIALFRYTFAFPSQYWKAERRTHALVARSDRVTCVAYFNDILRRWRISAMCSLVLGRHMFLSPFE